MATHDVATGYIKGCMDRRDGVDLDDRRVVSLLIKALDLSLWEIPVRHAYGG